MKQKLVFMNRSSVHYRKNIYMQMDKELEMDFFFGDSRPGEIKPVDESVLKNHVGHFHNVNFGPFYWQTGSLRLLRSDYTDIIMTGDTYCLSAWFISLFAHFFGKHVYHWTHGAYGNEKLFKKLMIVIRSNLADGLFLYGNHAKEILKTYGIKEEKMHVIYNSLSYDEHIEIRKHIQPSTIYSSHFGNKHNNIVFVGRLTKVKKLDQLLEAVAILKKKNEMYNVTFIGDGVGKQMLSNLRDALGLDNVWFYGACYDENELSELLYNADVCVSPGNVGLTAMHAMTFGTPVISHNNCYKQMPEFEAIEDGRTGTFFVEDDINSLAIAIERWFNKGIDREKIRKECYKVIDEKYNPHVQVMTMKKVLNFK